MIHLEYLEWDSVFFDKKIFRCIIQDPKDLDSIKKKLAYNNGDLCYIFSTERLDAPNNESFFLADIKVLFHKTKFPPTDKSISTDIISSKKFTSQLFKLAILSGQHSRFKIDRILSPKFDAMYKIWLEKSLSRQIANEVFVYEKNNLQLGFVTIKKTNQRAVVGLIAVDEAAQGRKIGSSLLRKIENWCGEIGVSSLEIATQMNNEQACAFYKKNNYQVKQIEYIYHCYNK